MPAWFEPQSLGANRPSTSSFSQQKTRGPLEHSPYFFPKSTAQNSPHRQKTRNKANVDMIWPSWRPSSLLRPTSGALARQKQPWLPTGGGAVRDTARVLAITSKPVKALDRRRPIPTETTRATTAKRFQPCAREDRTAHSLLLAFLRGRTRRASTTTPSGFRSSTHSDSLNACVWARYKQTRPRTAGRAIAMGFPSGSPPALHRQPRASLRIRGRLECAPASCPIERHFGPVRRQRLPLYKERVRRVGIRVDQLVALVVSQRG